MRKRWSGLDEATREGVFNEAMEIFFKRFPDAYGSADREWVPGYLFKTTDLLCRAAHSKNKRRTAKLGQWLSFDGSWGGSMEAAEAIAHDPFHDAEFVRERELEHVRRMEAVDHGLRSLKPRDRELIMEVHFKRTDMAAISERFGYASANSAKKAKCLALRKLRRYVFAALAA